MPPLQFISFYDRYLIGSKPVTIFHEDSKVRVELHESPSLRKGSPNSTIYHVILAHTKIQFRPVDSDGECQYLHDITKRGVRMGPFTTEGDWWAMLFWGLLPIYSHVVTFDRTECVSSQYLPIIFCCIQNEYILLSCFINNPKTGDSRMN